MTKEDKMASLADIGEDIVIFPDIADALIGYAEQFGQGPQALYDKEKVIEIYKEQGMSREEALEYFYFNTLGTGLAEGTPVFLTKFEDF
jgi:hypothetical protein